MALLPLTAIAQINGSGYYRVQNAKSQRFLTIVDNRASINWSNTTVDLYAFRTIGTFEETVCWNPATICYMSATATPNYYNISGQGLDLYSVAQTYMKLTPQTTGSYIGSYIISGEATKAGTTVSKTLYDSAKPINPANINTVGNDGYQYWNIRPVKNNFYFGIKPDFQATMENNDRYYTTVYASFPYQLGSDMKAYYIDSNPQGEYIQVKALDNIVPAGAPVIVECASEAPSDNKVDLLQLSTVSVSGNKLTGVYYCNDQPQDPGHNNVTEYRPTNMRVLGKAADGRLAFVTDHNLKYIPANKAYLTVPTGSPETLYVVTEIPSGIETVKTSDAMSVKPGVYTLNGQYMGDSVDGLSKGVYIVNGKKTVLK